MNIHGIRILIFLWMLLLLQLCPCTNRSMCGNVYGTSRDGAVTRLLITTGSGPTRCTRELAGRTFTEGLKILHAL